jgi:hypothetical protein
VGDKRELSTDDLASVDREREGGDAPVGRRAGADPGVEPLFPDEDTARYRGKWQTLQSEFIDNPRDAVEGADSLVADLMQRLASEFSDSRRELEQQWDRDENVSTEDLRVALTRYRSFFERLLSA